jgi:hypothetical protein
MLGLVPQQHPALLAGLASAPLAMLTVVLLRAQGASLAVQRAVLLEVLRVLRAVLLALLLAVRLLVMQPVLPALRLTPLLAVLLVVALAVTQAALLALWPAVLLTALQLAVLILLLRRQTLLEAPRGLPAAAQPADAGGLPHASRSTGSSSNSSNDSSRRSQGREQQQQGREQQQTTLAPLGAPLTHTAMQPSCAISALLKSPTPRPHREAGTCRLLMWQPEQQQR